jgi:four helix bundle protein
MFDFEKLEVYDHLRTLNNQMFIKVLPQIKDQYLHDQLKRAQMSTLLSLAEGTGHMTRLDKKQFYTVARSSLFEVVAILQVLLDLKQIDSDIYNSIYSDCEKGSKMLLGMIRSMMSE